MIDTIENELNSRLATLPDLPSVVFWPNAPADDMPDGLFIGVALLPGNNDLVTLGYREEFKGVYQVDVYGQAGEGVAAVNTLVSAVANHFAAQRKLANVSILAISIGAGVRDGDRYVKPVSVNYLSHASYG